MSITTEEFDEFAADIAEAERRGARRERARILRLGARGFSLLRAFDDSRHRLGLNDAERALLHEARLCIDAATHAPKKGKSNG